MPTLHELQRAMRGHVLHAEDAIVAMLSGDALLERLGVYRNTLGVSLTRALRLSFPAVHKLVGEAFFEMAAGIFITDSPPHTACLDLYGEAFSAFLARFEPAQGLRYLPDVAKLEWAVSRALHARDAPAIPLDALGAITEAEVGALRFIAHPSLTFLDLENPADAIWRAVLDGNDESLAAIELSDGPVNLIVERGPSGIVVHRADRDAWQFGFRLAEGHPFGEAIAAVPGADAISALAAHLAAGRFVALQPSACQTATRTKDTR